MNTIEQMRVRLAVFNPVRIEIIDESHLHAGHAGSLAGGGHYQLYITSEQFIGRNTLARHRMIYSALAEMMQQDIHALSIYALTP